MGIYVDLTFNSLLGEIFFNIELFASIEVYHYSRKTKKQTLQLSTTQKRERKEGKKQRNEKKSLVFI